MDSLRSSRRRVRDGRPGGSTPPGDGGQRHARRSVSGRGGAPRTAAPRRVAAQLRIRQNGHRGRSHPRRARRGPPVHPRASGVSLPGDELAELRSQGVPRQSERPSGHRAHRGLGLLRGGALRRRGLWWRRPEPCASHRARRGRLLRHLPRRGLAKGSGRPAQGQDPDVDASQRRNRRLHAAPSRGVPNHVRLRPSLCARWPRAERLPRSPTRKNASSAAVPLRIGQGRHHPRAGRRHRRGRSRRTTRSSPWR